MFDLMSSSLLISISCKRCDDGLSLLLLQLVRNAEPKEKKNRTFRVEMM